MIIQTGKISIDFKDTDYMSGSGVSVQNAKEGSVSGTGIEYTRDCTVQKDMGKGIVYTEADTNRMMEEAVENLMEERFDPAEYIRRNMTGEDAKEMEEEGSMLEEYVASSLERAIARVKSQRRDREESLEGRIKEGEEQRKHFEEIEQRIREAVKIAAGISGMSEAAAKYFLENNLKITPGNMKNAETVTGVSPASYTEVPFEQMRPQVEGILENAGLPSDEENMEAAQWLYEHDLPVTAEKVESYRKWQEISSLPEEIWESRIRDNVLDGQLPESADLSKISYEEAREKAEALFQADEQDFFNAYPQEAERITARRQLEEIRLRMTIDAVRTMEKKGIRVELDNLMEIVEELKEMEQEACRKYLNEAGLPDSDDNIEIVGRTLRAREDILTAPVAVLGRTIRSEWHNIEEIAREGNTMRLPMEELAEKYEAVGTEVRKDLGDSIQKAFGNVDGILQELELASTAANQRAVRILAYNRMPLNKEAVLSMKEYDAKVTTLVKNLKPQVVTELIRRQENPLEMSVDELSGKVAEISDEIIPEDISFRKYLWKLDHNHDILPQERKSMIGIYRLLDKVEKSDGAVIGQVVKEGKELSFASLLSAVRTRKAEGMDRTIDDDFGGLIEKEQQGERISDQIQAAFSEHVVSQLRRDLSPTVLHGKGDSLMEEPLEELLEDCTGVLEAQQEESEYYDQLAADIRRMAGQSDAEVRNFLKDLQLPESLTYIRAMKEYLEEGSKTYLRRYSGQEGERLREAMDDPEQLERIFDELDAAYETELRKKKEEPEVSYITYQEIAKMASSVSFYRQMRQYRKYEIPVETERGITACSVTIVQGSQDEKGTVEIAMDSHRFGRMQATFKVNGNTVSGFVTGETMDVHMVSEQIMTGFETDLEKNGLHMEREDFAKGRRPSFHLDKEITGAANQKLYLVAKLFIQNVQKGEDIV